MERKDIKGTRIPLYFQIIDAEKKRKEEEAKKASVKRFVDTENENEIISVEDKQ